MTDVDNVEDTMPVKDSDTKSPIVSETSDDTSPVTADIASPASSDPSIPHDASTLPESSKDSRSVDTGDILDAPSHTADVKVVEGQTNTLAPDRETAAQDTTTRHDDDIPSTPANGRLAKLVNIPDPPNIDLPSPSSSTTSEKPPLVSRTTSDGIKSKMSSSLSWFSRATNIRKPSGSPTRNANDRRGSTLTAASLAEHAGAHRDSISSMGRNAETLQERFQSLRMQSEAADTSDDPQPLSPITDPMSPVPMVRSDSASKIPTRDTKLPPGTVSGASKGVTTEDEGPVNWDLWQTLVQEGPNAVARTSGEQLHRAIMNGIPQPIRGVVWQILAQSKNDDLEQVYTSLAFRETEALAVRSEPLSRVVSNGAANNDAEVPASDASSIHSQSSSTGAKQSAPNTANDTITKVNDSLAVEKRRPNTADDSASLQKLEKTIRKDLGARTSYSKYVASAGMQESLFRVCKAYALYDEPVGYAQGINFIAMPLLFNMAEEEAFSLMVRLMSNYEMRDMFTVNMTGLHLRLYQFERLLEDYEPALYCHLHRREVSPNLYATQWFLTLFAYRFPLQLVLRIYDLVLSQGLAAVLKFGIVLMRKNAKTLLDTKDMSHLTTFLKEKIFDVYIDKSPSAHSILESGFFGSAGGSEKDVYHADDLIRDACAIEISPETLARYTSEFQEKTRIDTERQNEVESLRSQVSNLSKSIRGLEEQSQQHDSEHVGIASDLVRTKVENESLKDANEVLRTRVDELQKMVDSQPAEVEARLAAEMDRIMARNIEVQNSNRELEDANSDMEKQLVTVKLENAQLNADRDSLKQKIWGVQSMLGDAKI